MQAYRIVDWDKNYEVGRKGQQLTSYMPVEARRKGPLKFVRLKVNGLSIDPTLDEIISRSWQPGSIFHWAVLGIYNKLLEIAADQEREYRGWILDQKQKPMTPKSFAKRFREPDSRFITKVFDILCHPDVNLLEFQEIPEFSGALKANSGSLLTNSTNTTQPRDKKTKKIADKQKEMLFK